MKAPPRSLVLALLLATSSAHAEPPGPTATTARARKLFQDGLGHAQQGDLGTALQDFEAAYAARPHFSVLYNIAQTHAGLGHPVEAVAAFQRYLADGGKQISETRRSEVQALIMANRQSIGHLRIRGGSASTRIWLDGHSVSAEERDDIIPLAKGEHSIVYWNGPAPPESRALSVAGGALVEVTLPEPAPAEAPPPALTHLSIHCDVPEVSVEVIGNGAIKTPQLKPWLVPVGQLSVRFSRPGYPTLQRSIITAPEKWS